MLIIFFFRLHKNADTFIYCTSSVDSELCSHCNKLYMLRVVLWAEIRLPYSSQGFMGLYGYFEKLLGWWKSTSPHYLGENTEISFLKFLCIHHAVLSLCFSPGYPPPGPRTTDAHVIHHWTMKTHLNILSDSCCILKSLSGFLTASVVESLKLLQSVFLIATAEGEVVIRDLELFLPAISLTTPTLQAVVCNFWESSMTSQK